MLSYLNCPGKTSGLSSTSPVSSFSTSSSSSSSLHSAVDLDSISKKLDSFSSLQFSDRNMIISPRPIHLHGRNLQAPIMPVDSISHPQPSMNRSPSIVAESDQLTGTGTSNSTSPHLHTLNMLASNGSADPSTASSSSIGSPVSVSGLSTPMTNWSSNMSSRSSFSSTPCYVHSKFDEVTGVAKILKELSTDDMSRYSHSHLVKTATGVRELSKQLGKATIHMNVRTVLIVTKARDNSLVYMTRELARWLMATPRYGTERGVTVYVDSGLGKSKRFDASGLMAENPMFAELLRYWTPQMTNSCPELFDLVITLGGDGTVLYVGGLFQHIVPPVISFSLGSLGFLTNYSFHDYQRHLNHVFDNGINVNLRMRFTCGVYRRNGEKVAKHQVINEIVIDRGPSPWVSMLELYGDDSLLTVVQADGLILSTPTGSTAYSLSAGGSLVHPEIPAMCVTPICPHTLSFRPMLLPDSMALRVSVPNNSRATAWASFDGRNRIELKPGDYVTVKASQFPFPTLVSAPTEYIDSVSRTLKWNVREQQKPFAHLLSDQTRDICEDLESTPSQDAWDIDYVD